MAGLSKSLSGGLAAVRGTCSSAALMVSSSSGRSAGCGGFAPTSPAVLKPSATLRHGGGQALTGVPGAHVVPD